MKKPIFNRAGIEIQVPLRPPETYCLVFDGFTDNMRGIKYRYSSIPSRLKHSA